MKNNTDTLTPRETIVLREVTSGKKTRDIAGHFGVTPERIRAIRRKAEKKVNKRKAVNELAGNEKKLYMLPVGVVFSTRTSNRLVGAKLKKVGDLREKSDHELLKLPGLGTKGIREINNFFTEHQLDRTLPENQSLKEKVTVFLCDTIGREKNFGKGKARMIAELTVKTGLVTEASFEKLLRAETKSP
jgi:transcriptional regulator